jgi:uncharacterized membrane protein
MPWGTISATVQVLSLFAALLAAGLGVAAAGVNVRDNIDAFMSDLHKQSTLASWAATAAAVSAALQAVGYFLPH